MASHHASFVGVIGARSKTVGASERWRASVSRTRSRNSGIPRESARPPLLAAYRGGEQGFFEDDRHTILLDGSIDNLHELSGPTGAIGDAGDARPAELVARLFAHRGEELFADLTGSFSVAINAHATGEAVLARDRFGDRPLFYAETSAGWAFASEIKSLCPLLDRLGLSPEGLRQAIQYRYVLGDTLVEGVSQVMPACYVRLAGGKRPVEKRYWELGLRPESGTRSLEAYADQVDAGLDTCLSRLGERHRDVAILLSGGVDSSLLAAKAAKSGFRNCVALTARWPGENPELESAASVARHVGIEHRIIDIEESFIERSFPWIVWRFEEPPRHYNSFVLAKLLGAASGQFDAVLSGHAADALFGPPGLVGLDAFQRRSSSLRHVPKPLRACLAKLLACCDTRRFAHLGRCLSIDEHEYIQRFFEIGYRGREPILAGRRAGGGISSRQSVERFYVPLEHATERFQRFDLYTFNQSHTQVYDRLGAPIGVGVTQPFLSPELVGIAESLPRSLKLEGSLAKPVLKRLAARFFPRQWIYREHQGFPTPSTRWLRGPLDSWRRTLSDERTASRGLVDVEALRSADVDRDYEAIWTAMTLEMFCRQFIDGDGSLD